MIKAVILDFDGVVVESEPIHYLSFCKTLAPLGISIPKERWHRDFAGTGSVSIISTLFRESKIKENVRYWVEKRKLVYAEFVNQGMVKSVQGLAVFLSELKKRNIPVAIASGGHRHNILLVLEHAGLLNHFPVVFGAEDFKKRKPDPEVFLLASKKLGVLPSDCLVVEDSLPGIAAVKSAGMKLVVMASPATQHLNTGHYTIISNFSEFPFELLL